MCEIYYPSIFNDVLAPATQGPSSSNTAGVFRLTKIARELLRGEPESLLVEMSNRGGFVDTFFSMESDKACLAGILGQDLIRSDLGQVYEAAQRAGLRYKFVFTDAVEKIPTEMGRFTVRSQEETLTFTGITLGGGEILIREINGYPCQVKGVYEEELALPCWDTPRHISAVYPLTVRRGACPPFSTSEGMLSYAKERKIPLWEAALDYECSLTGLSREEIWRTAKATLRLAYDSIEAGYRDGIAFDGVTVAKAPQLRKASETAPLFPLGGAHQGGLDALAVMEYGNAHGVIVCMPTGGAAGIIPAAIKNAAAAMGKGEDEQIHALLTAGLLGVFYYPTHYHGALGCQAEVGVATSMAAGGIAAFLRDEPAVCERAAVLAIQYIIGQVCDPVAGYAQIPCFIRNIASVPLAMTCANYAVLGLDTAVTLDSMVQAVLRVGQRLRETRINDLGTCGGTYTPHPCSSCGRKRGE